MKNCYIILLTFLLVSCDFNTFRENKVEDKEEAQKVTEKFYSYLKKNNKEEIKKLFSPKFFKITSVKDFEQLLDWQINEGKKESAHSLVHWQTLVTKGTSAKSNYILEYDVKRGKIGTEEIFTLEKINGDIKIITYELNLNDHK